MSKHTPGTWLQSGRTVLSTRKQHLMIAQCVKSSVAGLNFSAEIDAEESDANARLIAAAPDLLEALKLAVEEIEDLRRFANNNGGMIDAEEFSEGRSAIAKAEGRS